MFSACGYEHMSDHAQQDQRDPLELALQTVVSHLTWVLGIEPRSSGRDLLTTEPSLQTPKFYVLYVCGEVTSLCTWSI